jgi:D-3-phosphoglycerate dehydrogenase
LEALSTHGPQVLIVRSTRVTAAALDASTHLGLIVRAGAGYDTIDVEGASNRGIFVANCPGKNSVAVAELTLGLILPSIARLRTMSRRPAPGTGTRKRSRRRPASKIDAWAS